MFSLGLALSFFSILGLCSFHVREPKKQFYGSESGSGLVGFVRPPGSGPFYHQANIFV
jgi:hypothetical protein